MVRSTLTSKMPPRRIKVNQSDETTRHRLPTRADRAKLGRSRIFQWTGHSSGLVNIGLQITLPPRIPDKDKVTETMDPMGSNETSGGQRILRRHRLRLSPEGLSIGVISLRWIDIGEISARDNVIEIFEVPVRQGPHGCTVMRYMKTTYSLEVPAGRKSEIESAIRQFMARWKVPLKGPFYIKK